MTQRLQFIPSQTIETVANDGSDNGDQPLSDLEEEMPSAIEHYDEDADEEDQEEYSETMAQPGTERVSETHHQELAKVKGTCYEMANTGRCNRPNCPYSHKPEDIEKLKKLRAQNFGQGKATPAKKVTTFLKPQGPILRKA